MGAPGLECGRSLHWDVGTAAFLLGDGANSAASAPTMAGYTMASYRKVKKDKGDILRCVRRKMMEVKVQVYGSRQ